MNRLLRLDKIAVLRKFTYFYWILLLLLYLFHNIIKIDAYGVIKYMNKGSIIG